MIVTNPHLLNTLQTKYSKKLLDKVVPLTKLIEYATLSDLPANAGATSIRFWKRQKPSLTGTGAPAALAEGVAPTNARTVQLTPIDVTLSQRGQITKTSDVASAVALIDFLDLAIELMQDEFVLDVDTLMRDMLVHPATGLAKRYAQATANFAGLAAATAANGCLVPRDLLDAMTALKIAQAPRIKGFYAAVLAPQVSRDILESSDWRDLVKTNYADKVFNGEIGELYGCKLVETTNQFQEDETEGTYATTHSAGGTNTTGFIYSTQVLGKGAYGAVNMAKMGASMLKPQVVITDKPDSGNPLGQFVTAGWKAYWGQTVLEPTFGVNLRSKSRFV